MPTKKPVEAADPSVPSLAWKLMAPKWRVIDSLLGGTSAMREAAQEYMPSHPAEDHTNYTNRLNSAVLYNVIELTRDSLVGRVFKEELRLNEDVPKEIQDLGGNIDLQHTDISSFAAEWFGDAVAKGFSHVLIDMPSISVEDRANRTLADDQKSNNRPFWSLLKPENVIFAYFEKNYGVDVLTHLRFIEMHVAIGPDGYSEVWETHIRVLRPGFWEVWKNKYENEKNRKPEWVLIDSGVFDLNIIPLVTFYTGKPQGNMIAKPPLEDLAYLNIRHWQSTSDQINVLTVARFPMLAASGTQIEAGKGNISIGPRQLLTMRDPNGRFYYVEHTGKAIASGQAELDGLVDQMSAYGSEFLRRQIAGRTAFERAADGSEATSPLKRMAIDFKGAVELALKITALWLKKDPASAGTITINTKFTEQGDSPANLVMLDKARIRMDISRETFIAEMVRTGAIDQTIDVAEEIARIQAESDKGPMNPSFITATESIRAIEAVDAGASAVDIASGKTKAPKTQTAVKPQPGAAKLTN